MFFRFKKMMEGEDKGSGGGAAIDVESIKKENEALKAKLSAVEPRLAKIEEEEKKREEKLKKDAEDKRKKELGVETVLKEKDDALTQASLRLEALEKRERERVDALFNELPDEFKKPIESVKDKLPLEEWSDLVNRQADAADAVQTKYTPKGMFSRPTGETKKMGETSKKALEMIEQTGKGFSMSGKMKVVQERDPESGHSVTKFTRQIHDFFKDMRTPGSKRLVEK